MTDHEIDSDPLAVGSRRLLPAKLLNDTDEILALGEARRAHQNETIGIFCPPASIELDAACLEKASVIEVGGVKIRLTRIYRCPSDDDIHYHFQEEKDSE